MRTIALDVWLYGPLAKYAGNGARPSYGHTTPRLQEPCTVGDLLAHLRLPTEERGLTFINGRLSAMPGVQPDLAHVLGEGDRVSLFHLRSMWPFQYRDGAALASVLEEELTFHQRARADG